MAKPVVLRAYFNPSDAHFHKALLEDAGIPVYIYDENVSSSTVAYTYVTGGIKLVVPDNFVDEALEILENDTTAHEPLEEPDEPQVCPKCNSREILRVKSVSLVSILLMLFVSLLFIQEPKPYKCTCRKCRHTWRDR